MSNLFEVNARKTWTREGSVSTFELHFTVANFAKYFVLFNNILVRIFPIWWQCLAWQRTLDPVMVKHLFYLYAAAAWPSLQYFLKFQFKQNS
jgi:hypothetical protein